MSTTYSLYVKTHNQTGLKYLGYTKTNPHVYPGSGTRWTNHIRSHGNDVTTEIIGTYQTKKELREAGVHYSQLWNVVDSKEWANLKLEEGDGGRTKGTTGKKLGPAWNIGLTKDTDERVATYAIKMVIHNKTNNIGRHFYNNGVIEKRAYDSPGPEWTKGRLPYSESWRRKLSEKGMGNQNQRGRKALPK